LRLQFTGNVPDEKSSKRRVVCAELVIDEIKRRRKTTLFMEIIFTNIRFALRRLNLAAITLANVEFLYVNAENWFKVIIY